MIGLYLQVAVLLLGSMIASPRAAAGERSLGKIQSVILPERMLHVGVGDRATISYVLTQSADVTVTVWGPNREQATVLVEKEPRGEGTQSESWNGTDWAGRPVPDEAYTFVIEAVSGSGRAYYDPLAVSGGERVNPRDIHFRPDENQISYVLPRPCRVLVRAGLNEGPMLNTLVNWLPRGGGACAEHWEGRDQQGLRAYSRSPRAFIVVQAYALPENSIITYGNDSLSYRDWYLAWGQHRLRRPPPVEPRESNAILSPHWGLAPHIAKDPPLEIRFPELQGSLSRADEPILATDGRLLVRIDIPDSLSRRFIQEQRFELVTFLDDRRISEQEQAHLPFNWVWDLWGVAPGEHWLTINLVTMRQYVGTCSQRIRIPSRGGE